MIITARIIAKDGKETDVEALLTRMVEDVRSEKGTLVYTLHKDLGNPRAFMFFEKYTDGDALTTHSQTPHFKQLFEDLKPLLDGAPEILMYSEVASIS